MYNMDNKPIYAIAVFNDKIKGVVRFTEELEHKRVRIELQLKGLTRNSLHGFHEHETHVNYFGLDPLTVVQFVLVCVLIPL